MTCPQAGHLACRSSYSTRFHNRMGSSSCIARYLHHLGWLGNTPWPHHWTRSALYTVPTWIWPSVAAMFPNLYTRWCISHKRSSLTSQRQSAITACILNMAKHISHAGISLYWMMQFREFTVNKIYDIMSDEGDSKSEMYGLRPNNKKW